MKMGNTPKFFIISFERNSEMSKLCNKIILTERKEEYNFINKETVLLGQVLIIMFLFVIP